MRLIEALKTAFRLLILDEKSMAIVMWKLRRGDSTLRVEYDLNPEVWSSMSAGFHDFVRTRRHAEIN